MSSFGNLKFAHARCHETGNVIATMIAEGNFEHVPTGTHVLYLLTHLDGEGETTAFKCRLADYVHGTIWEGGNSRIIDVRFVFCCKLIKSAVS